MIENEEKDGYLQIQLQFLFISIPCCLQLAINGQPGLTVGPLVESANDNACSFDDSFIPSGPTSFCVGDPGGPLLVSSDSLSSYRRSLLVQVRPACSQTIQGDQ